MILIPKAPIHQEVIHRALLAEGFSRVQQIPLTQASRACLWSRESDSIVFWSDLLSGLAHFVLSGPDAERLATRLRSLVPCHSVAERIARDVACTRPAEQARAALGFLHLGGFGYEKTDPTVSRSAMAEALSGWLLSEHWAVRNAALEAAFRLEWGELSPAVEQLAGREPEFAWVGLEWAKVQQSAADSEKATQQKQVREELLASLPVLVDQEKWHDALAAADQLLGEKRPPLAAYRARALALAGLERLWEATLWTAVWIAKSTETDEEPSQALAGLVPRLEGDVDDLGSPLLEIEKHFELDGFDRLLGALDLLLACGPRRRDELEFLTAALRVRSSHSQREQATAREPLERCLERWPDMVDGWPLLAMARNAQGDLPGAEAAFRRELALRARGEEIKGLEAALSRFAASVGGQEPRDEAVVRSCLRWLYREDQENLFRVASEEVDAPTTSPTARAAALKDRAIAATFTQRHEEAIRAYRDAIAAEAEDPKGLLRFNLACELARKGEKGEALASLGEAMERNEDWAADAQSDDYFAPLWADGDFLVRVSGLTTTPSRGEVERWMELSMGRHFRGEGKQAIAEGTRAAAGANLLGDTVLLAKALGHLGTALTYHSAPARGVQVLERGLALNALADDPVELARFTHRLGAAYHAAGRHEDAEAQYQRTLSLRLQALGEVDFEVAITYGDLARLALDRDRLEDGEALQLKARAVLDAVLPGASPDSKLDVLVNLAFIEGNRTWLAQRLDRGVEAVLGHAEATAGFLEALIEAEGTLPPGVIPRLQQVLATVSNEAKGALLERLATLAARLVALETPDPRVRMEKLYWAGLRLGIRELQSGGTTDREIAEGFARAVRGQDPGEPMASHPAFRNLAVEFSQRLTGSTDLVMLAMSLDLAASGAQPVEEAIGGLEQFALGNLEQ